NLTIGSLSLSGDTNSSVISTGGSATITASSNYNVAMTNSAIATISSAVILAGASSSVGLVVNSSDNTGTLVLAGANTFRGAVVINGSLVQISADNQLGSISSFNASAITLSGGLIEATQTFTLSSYRGITLGSSDGGLAASNGAILTYGGVITDGSSTNNLKINELGESGTVKLTGANTYGGNTAIYAGTLLITTDTALGSISGSYFHYTAGTIVLAGGTLQADSSLTLNPLRNISLNSSKGGLAASATVNLIYDGVITDGSATNTLIINGSGQAGSITLSGVNAYGGDTTVNGGTLVLASGGTLGNSNSTLYLNNAVLDLQTSITLQSLVMSGNSASIINSTGSSSILVKGSSTLIGSITTSSTQTYTGSVTLAGDVTLNTSNDMITVGYIYGGGFNFTTNSGTGNQSMGGGENINILTLDPIDFGSWFSDNNYNYSYSNNSYAKVTQSKAFIANSLLMYGYADFELTNSGNQFGMIAGSGTYSVNLNAQSDIHVGTVSWKGKSYQGIDSFNSVSLYSSQGDLYVDSGAYVSTSRSGGNIYLGTENRFINYGGSNSVRPYSGANWSIYSNNPDNNNFGGLDSGWNANWGGSSNDRFSDGHNHYDFKSKSVITITANDVTMTYGQSLPALSQSGYTISGNGVSSSRYGNIYSCDGVNVLSLLSSAPHISYESTPINVVSGMNAGTYSNVVLISGPSLSSNGKYLISYNPGDLVISKANAYVIIGAGQTSIYGSTPTINYTYYSTASGAGGAAITSPADLSGTATITNAPTSTSNAATYALTYANGLSSTNYTFNPASSAVNYVVNPATITITGANTNTVYNGSAQTNSAASVSINGGSATTISGTTVNTGVGAQSFILGGTYGSGTNASNTPYADTLTLTAAGGTTAGNYTVTINQGALTIGKANAYVIIGSGQSSTYGSTPTINYSYYSTATGSGGAVVDPSVGLANSGM
ncbi:beta strand repeat-containing protein, partial [Polynucleobacter asymbioticus]|uniref:beta strand repeat-containing protein n=1 Tax=Polynucleobacter asymbioticus TaxID=576611 RepID=UPI0011601356